MRCKEVQLVSMRVLSTVHQRSRRQPVLCSRAQNLEGSVPCIYLPEGVDKIGLCSPKLLLGGEGEGLGWTGGFRQPGAGLFWSLPRAAGLPGDGASKSLFFWVHVSQQNHFADLEVWLRFSCHLPFVQKHKGLEKYLWCTTKHM